MPAESKYKKEYNDQAEKLCKLGAADREIADFFGITKATLYSWHKKHPEFKEACGRGKLIADANVASSIYSRANGYTHPETKFFLSEGEVITAETVKHYPPETAAGIWWLRNRRPDLWSQTPDANRQGTQLPTQINIISASEYMKLSKKKDDDAA